MASWRRERKGNRKLYGTLSRQRNPVKESDSSMVAAARAVEAVVEDPLLPVLKLNPRKTQPSGDLGNPGFDHDPASPGPEIFVKDFVSHSQVGMPVNGPLARWFAFFLRDTGDRADFLREPFQGADSFKTLERVEFYFSPGLDLVWAKPQPLVLFHTG
jgi:hypothetical protein